MDKMPCHIVKDLLPLYIDDAISPETAESVRDHLEECKDCWEEYRILLKNLTIPNAPNVQEENSRVLKDFKKKWTVKKILIAAVSAVLAVVLFFPLRDAVMESELFAPTTWARAGTVGQLHLGDLSNGEWTRMYFIKEDLFSNGVSYWEPYLIFDNPFYKKQVINSANSATSVEIRILDTDGNVVLGPFTAEPGYPVSLEVLASRTEYIVEWRAEGDFYMFAFR